MLDYFSKKEMQELVDGHSLSSGDTINIHHCKEGKDNDRLYVTRDDDVTLFYCHHCHKRGALREAFGRYKKATAGGATNVRASKQYTAALPRDASGNVGEWHVRAKLWLNRAGIRSEEIKDRNLRYSRSLERVILPIYYNGELQGWQGRAIMPEQSPKYITKYKDRNNFIYHLGTGTTGCVIVEDMLSCIKMSRHMSCVAMLGSGVTEELFRLLVSTYTHWWVWSDYDNPQVKLQAHTLVNRLRSYGECKLVTSAQDPKMLSDLEIRECLALK